jgi:hypothetical protein
MGVKGNAPAMPNRSIYVPGVVLLMALVHLFKMVAPLS